MYQFDSGSADNPQGVLETLADSPGGEAAHSRGMNLATLAWEHREEADKAVAARAPEWPTQRQPIIDRNILRLGIYEMRHENTPAGVVISEAVELAKEFGTDKSASFVNALLDSILHEAEAE